LWPATVYCGAFDVADGEPMSSEGGKKQLFSTVSLAAPHPEYDSHMAIWGGLATPSRNF
jgi:hypothetical protein